MKRAILSLMLLALSGAFSLGGEPELPEVKPRAVLGKFWGGTNSAVLAFSPDSKLLAVGMSPPLFKLWDARSGKLVFDFNDREADEDLAPEALAFSPDGKTLAAALGAIQLWDVSGRFVRRSLQGHRGGVYSLVFSPDGKAPASASEGSVRLWDVAGGRERVVLRARGGQLHGLAFSPDGKRLVTLLADLVVWDASTGARLGAVKVRSGPTHALALAPDGKTVAVADDRNQVLLWDLEDVLKAAR